MPNPNYTRLFAIFPYHLSLISNILYLPCADTVGERKEERLLKTLALDLTSRCR